MLSSDSFVCNVTCLNIAGILCLVLLFDGWMRYSADPAGSPDDQNNVSVERSPGARVGFMSGRLVNGPVWTWRRDDVRLSLLPSVGPSVSVDDSYRFSITGHRAQRLR